MLSAILSLFLVPVTSQATSLMPMKSYAEVVDIQLDKSFPTANGTVTYMQPCAASDVNVQLSKPILTPQGQTVKLRVEYSSFPGEIACAAMPTKQQLNFTVSTQDGPVTMIADTQFGSLQVLGLDTFYFQPGSQLAKTQVDYAGVQIDLDAKVATLTLYRHSHCAPGVMCILSVPAPIVYSLPIHSVQTGGCNEVIYTASTDHRPVDGVLTQLTIVDNSKNYCKSVMAIFTTVAQLKIEGSRPHISEHHTIQGFKKLQPVVLPQF